VHVFHHRPQAYVWLDATSVKVRQVGRIVSVAVIVAVGVADDGRREILGMTVGPRKRNPSGPNSSDRSLAAACVASSG
jgi:transposase-like protein